MAGLLSRLKSALTKTSSKIGEGIEHIFVKKKLDDEALEELEEVLLSADVGGASTGVILEQLRRRKFNTEISPEEIKEELASIIAERLAAVDHSFSASSAEGLQVIMVCGVNGNGKTTTIGKLANSYRNEGKKVAVAACDTYRAAAMEQLEVWTKRAGVKIYKGEEKSDPASVAYKAVSECLADGTDILFVDTAGRLHNQSNLMDELAKIVRVISKAHESAPQSTLLVIDGTTGQNAAVQTEQFQKIAGVTGLVITKLDGTAKAGAVVGIVEKYKLPVHFIGLGEGIGDLKPFDSRSFARALVGLAE